MELKYLYKPAEISAQTYRSEFDAQVFLYGSAINRTSIVDGNFHIELIDYLDVWDRINGPEPVVTERSQF